jgi:hypothetical protein
LDHTLQGTGIKQSKAAAFDDANDDSLDAANPKHSSHNRH